MDARPVRLGVIGLGPRAETLLATLRNFSQEECRVTAVCDIAPRRVEKILGIFAANKLPAPRACADHKSLLADKEVDAVLIPTSWNSHLAIAAKLLGFTHIGKVEFDVLNGLDEFFRACGRLGLKCVCGMDTRVFIPEMAEHELNSPGEKGVASHLGIGFRNESLTGKAKSFAADLAARAGKRTRTVVTLVNDALKDLRIDFDKVKSVELKFS